MPLQKLALRWKKYNGKIEPRSEVKDGLDISYGSIHHKIMRTGACVVVCLPVNIRREE
jgi:hypothetical protein